MSVTISAAVTSAEANLCLLLAKAYSLPGEFSKLDPDHLSRVAEELPTDLGACARDLAAEWAEAMDNLDSISLAHARLFLGPFEVLASPYASTYLEPDGKLMGETSVRVAEIYAEAALGPGNRAAEAPDHIALEWEYLYFAGYQSITADDPVWLERIDGFLKDHLVTWVPQLVDRIKAADEHPFFRSLAKLTERFLRHMIER